MPEDFTAEGLGRGEDVEFHKRKRNENKKKTAHESGIRGEEYICHKAGKTVADRNSLKPRCNGLGCTKLGQKCSPFIRSRHGGCNSGFLRDA